MGVLQEIIREATTKGGDVPRMLRLCMILGRRLQHLPLITWVQYELDGYPSTAELPTYRQFRARNRGLFENFQSQVTLEIPLSVLPVDLAAIYKSAQIRDGVGELTHLLITGQEKGRVLQIAWVPEDVLYYLQDMAVGATCIKAWREISVSELAGALDQIKSRVLGFALDIEQAAPNAGDIAGTDHLLLKEEKLTQIFNNNISGTVQNLANGSHDFSQLSTTGIQAGDLPGLLAHLRAQGLPEDDVASLNDAIEVDTKVGMGATVKNWMGDLASRAATGALEIGLDKVTAVVMPALTDYFKNP